MKVRLQSVTVLVAALALGAAASSASGAVAQQQGGSPTSRADTLEGTPEADTLDGKAGHDTLDGGAGADTIDGGPGRDFVLGGGGNDTIDARDGYVDAVHCGNGRDTVTADEKDAVSETCEDVSPPPEDDRTVTLAVRVLEQERVPDGYLAPLIEVVLRTWLPEARRPAYCAAPPCVFTGPAKPPNEVSFFRAPAAIGPGFPEPPKFGVLASGDCWKHRGPNPFDGQCTLQMDRDRVVLVDYWPCEEIAVSWRRGNVCAD